MAAVSPPPPAPGTAGSPCAFDTQPAVRRQSRIERFVNDFSVSMFVPFLEIAGCWLLGAGSETDDDLPYGPVALHEGVRLSHLAEVEGSRAQRRQSARGLTVGDRPERCPGHRQGRSSDETAGEEAEPRRIR